ncbi:MULTISPECIES: hypothetical protein [unclassified Nocardia]|uniref:hypothetical protein n=1 Tax=unclassified Nocardia TaxID=2637762 RepID=UPI00278C88A0|nr:MULTISPECIES: hypothetical protein [unclassified Nocardia]
MAVTTSPASHDKPMKGTRMFMRRLTIATLLAAAAPVALPAPAHADMAVVCHANPIGPRKAYGADAYAPIQYGFQVSCNDVATNAPVPPDVRTITVELVIGTGNVVASFQNTSTDAQTEETHLYSCYGGPALDFRVNVKMFAIWQTIPDQAEEHGDPVSLEC